MRSSRYESDFEKTHHSSRRREKPVIKLGSLYSGRSFARNIHYVRRSVLFKEIDEFTFVTLGLAEHDGQVFFSNFVVSYRFGKSCRAFIVFRKNHNAARNSVEPVKKSKINVARLSVSFLDILLENGKQIGVAGSVCLTGQVLRLIDHDNMFILVKHGDIVHCKGSHQSTSFAKIKMFSVRSPRTEGLFLLRSEDRPRMRPFFRLLRQDRGRFL